MNLIRKGVCRAYQAGFRLALPLLPYRTPELHRSVEEIPEILRREEVERVLLVTDQKIRAAGLAAPLERLLAEAGIACAVYDGTVANPTVDNVEEARDIYRREGCEALIAFGGGSSMDCAKAVGARLARPCRTIAQMNGILKVRRALPPFVTATTGMDALTHAVEAYIGRSATAETRRQATEAVRLVFANVERACADGEDMEARTNMLRAAFLAGSAFTKSYVGYVHAVAHSLGGAYNIPHGLANAVLLPAVLEAYGPAAERPLHELGCAAGVSAAGDSDGAGAEKFISAIRRMNRRMGIPASLSGIREEDIPRLAGFASREANPLYPVPCLWDAGQLERFYYAVMEGGTCDERIGDRGDRRPAARVLPERRYASCDGAR